MASALKIVRDSLGEHASDKAMATDSALSAAKDLIAKAIGSLGFAKVKKSIAEHKEHCTATKRRCPYEEAFEDAAERHDMIDCLSPAKGLFSKKSTPAAGTSEDNPKHSTVQHVQPAPSIPPWEGLDEDDFDLLEKVTSDLAFLMQRVNRNVEKGTPGAGTMAAQGFAAIDRGELSDLAQKDKTGQVQKLLDIYDESAKSQASGWTLPIMPSLYDNSLYNAQDPSASTHRDQWGFDRAKCPTPPARQRSPYAQFTMKVGHGGMDNVRIAFPKEVRDQDYATAASFGLTLNDRGTVHKSIPDGPNCYKCDAALIAQDRGIECLPMSPVPQTNMIDFENVQMAKLGAYENIPSHSGSNEKELERIRKTYPDGTWLSIWDGQHALGARLMNGKWYHYDGWRAESRWDEDQYGRLEISSKDLDRLMNHVEYNLPKGSIESQLAHLMGHRAIPFAKQIICSRFGISPQDYDKIIEGRCSQQEVTDLRNQSIEIGRVAQAAKMLRAFKVQAKMSLRKAGKPFDDESVRQYVNSNTNIPKINGAFVIRPDQPLVPEIFKLLKAK